MLARKEKPNDSREAAIEITSDGLVVSEFLTKVRAQFLGSDKKPLYPGKDVTKVQAAAKVIEEFPQALEECAAVVRWLAANGAEWGLDTDRIALVGDSAGGNLALATALLLRETGGPELRGIVAVYPVCDADFSRESYRRFGAGEVSFDVLYAGERRDFGFPDQTVLPAYWLANLSARVALGEHFTLLLRAENLFDEDYELASGYNSMGQSFFGALRYEFR